MSSIDRTPRANSALSQLIVTEEEQKLWERRPSDFPIWYSRRLAAYSKLLTAEGSVGTRRSQTLSSFFRRSFARNIQALQDMTQAMVRQPRRDVVLLTSGHFRRVRTDGSAPCIFSTHLEEQLRDRLQVLEAVGEGPLPREREHNVCAIDLAFEPAYRFTRTYRTVRQLLSKRTDSPDADAFRVAGDKNALAAAEHASLLYRVARAWFERTRPRAVFVLCAYSRFAPLQLAAKHLGIAVIELQHGVIHESHPGYVFPSRLPIASFDNLPIPHHLVTFGTYFGELLGRCSPYWRGRWSVGGHPWLQETVRSTASTDAPEICFFSQCEAPVRAKIRTFARELRQALPSSVRIGIKPHPREQTADVYYREALDLGVRLLGPGDDSYALLKQTQMAVCVHSTVVIEALAFSCTAVAIESTAWTEAIEGLVNSGQIKRARQPNDLLRLWQRRTSEAHNDTAHEMFGVGRAAPDFEQLIARVRGALEGVDGGPRAKIRSG